MAVTSSLGVTSCSLNLKCPCLYRCTPGHKPYQVILCVCVFNLFHRRFIAVRIGRDLSRSWSPTTICAHGRRGLLTVASGFPALLPSHLLGCRGPRRRVAEWIALSPQQAARILLPPPWALLQPSCPLREGVLIFSASFWDCKQFPVFK